MSDTESAQPGDDLKVVEMRAPRHAQPFTNPAHTHMQIMFTSGSHFMVPIHIDDAMRAVKQWSDGSTVVSIRPTDGTAFHINVNTIIYLRQISYETAEAMLAEQQKMNEAAIAEQQSKIREQDEIRRHNATIRALQMEQAKVASARGGKIIT
jgi:hypothetical protein